MENISMKKGKKITILGAGNVGATVAYTLTLMGMASEIVLIDINEDKARGEAMDIIQGTAFSATANIHAGGFASAAGSDIVVVTVGLARRPGQTRIDLAQANIDVVKQVVPEIVKYAPDAVYVVVSNPVDILTYAIVKISGLPAHQVIGSGTTLDSARLRSRLAEHVGLNIKNVHAYVFGEHGDSSVIPWSLVTIGGMEMEKYCTSICAKHNQCGKCELKDIEQDVRTAGAQVIGLKGATYYAIGMSVARICECILRDTDSVLTVSGLIHDAYGLNDVCLSLPFVVGGHGIKRVLTPPLLSGELEELRKSGDILKEIINSLDI